MKLLTQLLNHIIKTYGASIYWIDDEDPGAYTHIVLRNDTTSFSLNRFNLGKKGLIDVDLDLISLEELKSETRIGDSYTIYARFDANCFDDYVTFMKEYFDR